MRAFLLSSAPLPAVSCRRGTRFGRASSTTRTLATNKPDNSILDDYYELLEVSPEADEDTIKGAYRRMQRIYHPDLAGVAGEQMSMKLNAAYEALMNPEARRAYNLTPRKKRSPVVMREGLVGPFRSEKTVFSAKVPPPTEEAALTAFELTDAIQDWAKTIAFTTELPLPYPLQVDTLPDGVRMAIVTVSNGSIRTMGELLIYIHDDDLAEKEEADDATAAGREAFHSANTEAVSTSAAPGGITVEVVRRWSIDDRSGPLPGEDRIMKVFKSELKDLVGTSKRSEPFQLGGLLAAAFSFALPALPTFPGMISDSAAGGGYKAYRLARSCRLGADGRQPQQQGQGESLGGGLFGNSNGF